MRIKYILRAGAALGAQTPGAYTLLDLTCGLKAVSIRHRSFQIPDTAKSQAGSGFQPGNSDNSQALELSRLSSDVTTGFMWLLSP